MPEVELPTISTHASRGKLRREDLKADQCLCEHCGAKCCLYFALPIERPTEWADFEDIRWFLLHERAAVFVEDKSWYLLVQNRCRHLRADHLCDIYENRPSICRDYATHNCEYDDEWVYDHYWETPEQVEEYAEAVLGPRAGKSVRSPKPRAAAGGESRVESDEGRREKGEGRGEKGERRVQGGE